MRLYQLEVTIRLFIEERDHDMKMYCVEELHNYFKFQLKLNWKDELDLISSFGVIKEHWSSLVEKSNRTLGISYSEKENVYEKCN